MRQRQEYPIKTEHGCVEALQTIWHMCNTAESKFCILRAQLPASRNLHWLQAYIRRTFCHVKH